MAHARGILSAAGGDVSRAAPHELDNGGKPRGAHRLNEKPIRLLAGLLGTEVVRGLNVRGVDLVYWDELRDVERGVWMGGGMQATQPVGRAACGDRVLR